MTGFFAVASSFRSPARYRGEEYTFTMTSNVQNGAGVDPAVPARWAADVESRLAAGEQVQACLETDLDHDLKFAGGLLLVTDRRLLARAAGQTAWQEWPLRAGLQLTHHDHAGVGTLELLDTNGRLATWRYTLARNLAALRVIAEFDLHRDSVASGQPVARPDEDVCPKCKTPLPPGDRLAGCHANRPSPLQPGRCSASGALPAPIAGNCSGASR